MATISQVKPVCIRGGRVKFFPVAASQTWYVGQWVYLDSYGRLTVCSSDSTVTCGMALSDNSTATTDTEYPILVPDAKTEFELNVIHSAPTSATTTKSLVGQSFNYESATTGAYVDRSAQTVPFFHVERLSPKDVEGDLFGRVEVTMVPEALQLGDSLD